MWAKLFLSLRIVLLTECFFLLLPWKLWATVFFNYFLQIKIIDDRHSQETTYHFDGVFAGSDPNKKVAQKY